MFISCAEAKLIGLTHYFTGVACRRGHIGLRHVANNNCVACNNLKTNKWREKNQDKERARNREWYARNVDAQRERGRKKRDQNVDRYREYSRSYNAENLPRLAAIARNRRARLKASGGTHTFEDVERILRAQGGKCAYCHSRLRKYHVDHIIPVAAGGTNDPRNLQVLCAPCNQSKSARDPIKFMQERGRLL